MRSMVVVLLLLLMDGIRYSGLDRVWERIERKILQFCLIDVLSVATGNQSIETIWFTKVI